MLQPCMTSPPSTLRACPVMYSDPRRYQESDHTGDILRRLHPPQWDLVETAAGELRG
jgi:hypothetical protein